MKVLNSVILLQDGTALYGEGFGARAISHGELVFNTSMTGYQEALTDPSYAGQILVMTNPLIGNYGINNEDSESERVQVSGFAVRSISSDYSHYSANKSVARFLEEYLVPGISGIDTRFLVRKIRSIGVMPALIATYSADSDFSIKKLKPDFDYSSFDFVSKVTIKKPKTFGRKSGSGKRIALVDYGMKHGILDELLARGLEVVVMPGFATSEDILKFEPDGIMLSNGPGDPSMLTHAHTAIRKLSDRDCPIFGICLGNQLLAHAFGGNTFKLKFGHRGSNHPVIDLKTGKTAITTQNHGFAVNPESVRNEFEITHSNLNDGTVEGMEHRSRRIFSVQYHPEARPGPHDSKHLFDRFVRLIEGSK